jgi:hypothetical protein
MLIFIDKPKITSMIKQSQDRRARLPRYEEHVNKMERRTSVMGMHASETALAIQKEQQQLKDVIRASIQQLVQYIFPIIPVQPVPRLEHMFSILPYHTSVQNITAKWLTLLLYMQEVLNSSLGIETRCFDWDLCCFSQSVWVYGGIVLYLGHDHFISYLSDSVIVYHMI